MPVYFIIEQNIYGKWMTLECAAALDVNVLVDYIARFTAHPSVKEWRLKVRA